MSLADDLLATTQAELQKRAEQQIPKAWRASERRNIDGSADVTSQPYEGSYEASEAALLADHGYDPETHMIVGGWRESSWTAYKPKEYRRLTEDGGADEDLGAFTFTAKAFKFKVVERPQGSRASDVDELVRALDSREPAKPVGVKPVGVGVIYAIGDLQLGKALADETPTLTANRGWVPHGDIKPGDYVYGPDGKPKKVLGVTGSTEQQLYDVQFDKGVTIRATADHVWSGKRRYHPKGYRKGGPSWEWRELEWTTEQIADIPQIENVNGSPCPNRAFNVELPSPLEMPDGDLPVDPYTLGLWLGNGNTATEYVCFDWRDSEDALRNSQYVIKSNTREGSVLGLRFEGLRAGLEELGVYSDKRIPEEYLMAGLAQRLALLQGLMDTDGHCAKNGVAEYSSSRKQLAEGFYFLAHSLGLKARFTEKRAKLNGEDYGPTWRVTFFATEEVPPFRFKRKAKGVKAQRAHRVAHRQVQRVVPAGRGSAQCLNVEGSLYLAGTELVVTHNCESPLSEVSDRVVEQVDQAAGRIYHDYQKVEHLHVAFLGDCIEGVVSQGGSLRWRTTLTMTEQVRVLQRLMMYAVEVLAPLCERLTVASVPGNHDRADSKDLQTRTDDSWAVQALVSVEDAIRFSGREELKHAELYVPGPDEHSVVLDVSGLRVAHIHGDQHRLGKHFDWLAGQSLGRQPEGDADLLLEGHWHHLQVIEQGHRTYICVPAMESESVWWKHKTGTPGNPGSLLITVNDGKVSQIDRINS